MPAGRSVRLFVCSFTRLAQHRSNKEEGGRRRDDQKGTKLDRPENGCSILLETRTGETAFRDQSDHLISDNASTPASRVLYTKKSGEKRFPI